MSGSAAQAAERVPERASERAALQRRTVRTLIASQAVGALGITIGISTASLLASKLSGSDQLAGLAQTMQVVGAAGASWLLARVMARSGRRLGLVTGYLLGAAGAGLAVLAGVVSSMPLLLVGAAMLGATSSANYAARYAATDLADVHTRGRSLSIVVWATTIGAVAGPNLTGPAASLADALGIPRLTGPFALGAVGMLLAALVVTIRLRPDPLLVARAGLAQKTRRPTEESTETRPAAPRLADVLRERPVILVAILGLAAAHAVMVSVMAMTPLHMTMGHATLKIVGIVISLHVLGMYAFAPLVGLIADRFGRPLILGVGGLVQLGSLVLCAISPEGSSLQIFAGLFLLGLGWSLATVAGSTLVAEQAPLEALTTVQGSADMVMNLAAAAGSAFSGVIVGEFGFGTLAGFASVFAAVVLIAAGYSGQLARRTAFAG